MLEGYTKYYCQWCLRDIDDSQMIQVKKKNGDFYKYPRKIKGRIVCTICASYYYRKRKNSNQIRDKSDVDIKRNRGLWLKILQQA